MTVSKEYITMKEQNRLFDEWCEKRPAEPRVVRPVMADPDIESWFIVAVIGTILCFLSGVEIGGAYVLGDAASLPLGEIQAFAWLILPALWVGLCHGVVRAVPCVVRSLHKRKLIATGWAEYDRRRQQWLRSGEAMFSQWFTTNEYIAVGYDNITA